MRDLPCPADADNELDRELLQHKQAQAASLAASSNTMLQRVRRFLKPPREELEAMPFGQRMQYEMVNSFLQVRGWGIRFRPIHPPPRTLVGPARSMRMLVAACRSLAGLGGSRGGVYGISNVRATLAHGP